MADVNVTGSRVGTPLQSLLMCGEIAPGTEPSYQICKVIYEYHPLGQKIAESPIKMAQSQARDITIPGAPEAVKKAFLEQWIKDGANRHIRNFVKTSRIYGAASLALLQDGVDSAEPIEFDRIWKDKIAFNVFDPLNTAGSLVLNQQPNAFDFQKHTDISVSGRVYHRSRAIVMFNEEPIYISYTSSAFGFVGRSAYQRALFPLKTFVQTMITDDLVTVKAGVIVTKMKQVTSAVSNAVSRLFGIKRDVVKEAVTTNVISIDVDEDIQTLDMTNVDTSATMARTNCLKNVTTACDMPAIFLGQETMVSGFGEGTEDAKNVAKYIDDLREHMQPAYSWMDKIIAHRAWNPDFYKALQNEYPEQYGEVDYETAFYSWLNKLEAVWPSLLVEPDSEKAKTDDVKLKALIAAIEVLAPLLDPENKAKLIEWASDNFNDITLLLPYPLELHYEVLAAFEPPGILGEGDSATGDPQDGAAQPKPPKEPPAPPTFSGRDSALGTRGQVVRL